MTLVAVMALALCSCRKIELHDTGALDFSDYYSMPSPPPPVVVKAGPDQTITLPLDSTYLDGSSTPNGLTAPEYIMYRWTKISGPTQHLLNSATPLPPASFRSIVVASRLVPGVYLFALTVEQPGVASVTDTVQVTVLDDPENRNTLTYHNLIWQKANLSVRSWQTTFLSTPARPDLWDPAGVHRRNLEFYLRTTSQSTWINVPFVTNTTAPYVWSGLPNTGLILTQPDNPSLVGTKADMRIKIL
jgi:hypothetical protein